MFTLFYFFCGSKLSQNTHKMFPKYWTFVSFFYVLTCIISFRYLFITCNAFIAYYIIYANLVILATAVTYYQLSGGESGTLRVYIMCTLEVCICAYCISIVRVKIMSKIFSVMQYRFALNRSFDWLDFWLTQTSYKQCDWFENVTWL